MKKLFAALLLLASAPLARAHDHVQVGLDPDDDGRLAMDGPVFQLALYVPPGEPFSGYILNFPGGWFANEFSFTTEEFVLEAAAGADPRVELVSVNGPQGGTFGFWEVGATTPTWERAAPWTNSVGDIPSFDVIRDGANHVHGRMFSFDTPGEYTIVVRVVDKAGIYAPSEDRAITYLVLTPPPLSLKIEGGNTTLSFTSRVNLNYELQSCVDLIGGLWEIEDEFSGDGTEKVGTLPTATESSVFYRLVEY